MIFMLKAIRFSDIDDFPDSISALPDPLIGQNYQATPGFRGIAGVISPAPFRARFRLLIREATHARKK
jgi:hypothetical protein